jgi:predicted ATPase/DNA-binding SARP family transcriptional activator
MTELRINLLGAPRTMLDGKSISLGRKKVLGLLAYLVVTDRPHSRDTLAALFWPDYDQSGARANLRRDISRLRRTIGERFVELEGDQVRLADEAGISTDVNEFHRLVEQAIAHGHSLRAGSPPLCQDCFEALTRAVVCYEGDFMAGFSLPDSAPYDEWQFFETENLHQKLAEALQHLVLWHLRFAEYERAIEYARRWLALDPLHEPAHRQLMQLYAWAGQHAAAIRQYQELSRTLKKELKISPDEETTRLFEAIQAREISPPAPAEKISPRSTLDEPNSAAPPVEILAREVGSSPFYNLPPQATDFVGREEELAALEALLCGQDSHRLVTILGPGGSGKTRLAIETARRLAQVFPEALRDGVWFVPLAPLTSTGAMLPAIDELINFSFQGGQATQIDQLIEFLKSRRVLFVLDNFEHLVDEETVHALGRVLAETQHVRILVTSRVRLNLHAEYVFPLEGLRIPQASELSGLAFPQERFDDYSALKLFEQSARRFQPDFRLTDDNVHGAVDICHLVQGMPLGIELATAWLEMLRMDEIAAEIRRSLDFLETDWDDMPDRQRSLRAVFNSSWNLLTEAEQECVVRLSVFLGSFSLDAARSISDAPLKSLLGLVHKSWLQRTAEGRFVIHELLRQYAFERLLADRPAMQNVLFRHATYFADFLAEQNMLMRSPDQKEAFNAIRNEFDHIRNAWMWLVEQRKYEIIIYWMLPAVFRYCESRLRASELMPLLQAVQQILPVDPQEEEDKRAIAIAYTAEGAFYKNGYPVRFEAFGMLPPPHIEPLKRAWVQSESLAMRTNLCFWRVMLCYLYGRLVDLPAGMTALKELIPQFRQENRQWDLAFALMMLGQLYELNFTSQAEMEECDRICSESFELFNRLGDLRESGHALRTWGNLFRFQDRHRQAIEAWENAQVKLVTAGDWLIANDLHFQIGDLHLEMGEYDQAFTHYRAMSDTYAKSGHKSLAARVLSKESYEALRAGDLPRAYATRMQSLEFCRQSGDVFGEAWSLWELGEYYRVAGDIKNAFLSYDRSLPLFEQVNDRNGYTFFHKGMGDLALQTGDYPRAYHQFQLSLERARDVGHAWGGAYALYGVGCAALGLGDLQEADTLLAQALHASRNVWHNGLTLLVLSGIASLRAAQGEPQEAVALAAFVAGHVNTWYEVRIRTQALLAELAAQMEPASYEAAAQRAQTMKFDDFNFPGPKFFDFRA